MNKDYLVNPFALTEEVKDLSKHKYLEFNIKDAQRAKLQGLILSTLLEKGYIIEDYSSFYEFEKNGDDIILEIKLRNHSLINIKFNVEKQIIDTSYVDNLLEQKY